ncbi:amidohydrolase [Mycolicibacterium sp. CBMA 295]|nr:amidohydrolase [Mycolicibacterium sp. CBMA 295]
MSGIGEGHSHPIQGGMEQRGPLITGLESVEEIVDEVRRFADEHPDLEWISGASYNSSLVPGGLFDARWLDRAVSDRPVVLRGWDYHTLWCNSEALRRAGITSDTPEPEMGEIPRRDDGQPLGVLREWGAMDLLEAVAPAADIEERLAALTDALGLFASYGITWAQDALVEPADVEVYLEASRRGLLNVRMNLAQLADPRRFPECLPEMVAARDRIEALGDPLLSANTIKFFADGVIESETASLLEPYCTASHRGMRVWEPDQLTEAVTRVREAGFQPYIHAIGDDAVRCALDAMEASSHATTGAASRPVITHVQLAAKSDLARFAQLGVIANLQPYWAKLDPLMTVLTIPRLGDERAARQYQTRTLIESGAHVSFGSDWPCSTADPRQGIAIAVSRTTAAGDPSGGWVPEQIIDIETALDTYTRGTAYQSFADSEAIPGGRLGSGFRADLVWFDRDPRECSPDQIRDLKVVSTFVAGQLRYAAGR